MDPFSFSIQSTIILPLGCVMMRGILTLLLVICCTQPCIGENTYDLAMLEWLLDAPPGVPLQNLLVPVQLGTGKKERFTLFVVNSLPAGQLAIDLVNNGTFPDILLNTTINKKVVESGFSASVRFLWASTFLTVFLYF